MRSFAERGYAGTTVERIVELAGTTPPTFYRYFSGKRDLLHPLRDFLAGEVWKVLKALDRRDPQSLADIRAWAWKYERMWRRLRRLCAALWEAVAADASFAAETMPVTLESIDGMTSLLESVDPGSRDKLRLRLGLLVVLLDRTVHLAGADLDETRASAMIDEFAEILWLSLYSTEARALINASRT